MHVIIVGGGKIGMSLAEKLAAHKHDVVVIDEDKRRCQEVADAFNGVVINGDATEMDVLNEAKVEKANVFVAVTSSEEVNLLSCLLAKEVSKAKTLARITKPHYEKLFKKAGIDIVLSPEVALASRLESLITEPDVVDIAIIHRGSIEMLELNVTEKSKVVGKTIKEIERPKGASIVAMKQGDDFVIPDIHTVFKPGDEAIVIVRKDMEKKMVELFE